MSAGNDLLNTRREQEKHIKAAEVCCAARGSHDSVVCVPLIVANEEFGFV